MGNKLARKHNPFACDAFGRVSITIGDEAANVRNVAIQFLDENRAAIAERVHCQFYLASSGTTLAPATSLPSALAIGTNGILLGKGAQMGGVVDLTDSTGYSGTHDDTLAATTVPADLTGGEDPTEAEHNAVLALLAVMAQNASDTAQKVKELVALNPLMRLVTSAAGLADINITKTGAASFWLVLLLPDGSVVVSDEIAFAS